MELESCNRIVERTLYLHASVPTAAQKMQSIVDRRAASLINTIFVRQKSFVSRSIQEPEASHQALTQAVRNVKMFFFF